jgi:large subunit ribosomal protein L14e
MYEIGRICLKIAGRDAGKKCVIVDIIDDKFVMIDGETRRRKCNIIHLEPLNETIDIPKNATHSHVANAMNIKERKTTPKARTEKPKKKKMVKKKPEEPTKKKKK